MIKQQSKEFNLNSPKQPETALNNILKLFTFFVPEDFH